jgi:hypothetical protein
MVKRLRILTALVLNERLRTTETAARCRIAEPKTENLEKSILRPDLARTIPTPHPAIPGALKSSNAPPVIFQEGRFCRDVSINAGVFSKNAGAIIGHHH